MKIEFLNEGRFTTSKEHKVTRKNFAVDIDLGEEKPQINIGHTLRKGFRANNFYEGEFCKIKIMKYDIKPGAILSDDNSMEAAAAFAQQNMIDYEEIILLVVSKRLKLLISNLREEGLTDSLIIDMLYLDTARDWESYSYGTKASIEFNKTLRKISAKEVIREYYESSSNPKVMAHIEKEVFITHPDRYMNMVLNSRIDIKIDKLIYSLF
jgi:hypothetical protein